MLWTGDGWKHSMKFLREDTPKLFSSESEAKSAIPKEVLPYILRWQSGWEDFIRGWDSHMKKASKKYPRVVKDIEDDFKRKAITVRERDELLKSVEDAETEREAEKIVRDHRRGRTA